MYTLRQTEQFSNFLNRPIKLFNWQNRSNNTQPQQTTDVQMDVALEAVPPTQAVPMAEESTEDFEDEELDDTPQEIREANQEILSFFIEQSKNTSLELFLERFDEFFIEHDSHKIPKHLSRATYHILVFNRTADFINLLNRCCYVFVGVCLQQKQTQYIPQLIALFEKSVELPPNAPLAPRKFRDWVVSFTHSHQFQTLKMFAPQTKNRPRTWGDRYIRFTLLAQSFNPQASIEQRQASQMLYQFLKNRYKFQLVMYLTRGCDAPPNEKSIPNPTCIHPSTLKLIHKLMIKKQRGYPQMAEEFLTQTDKITYGSFKRLLGEHLLLAIANNRRLKWLPEKLNQYLLNLYKERDDRTVDQKLITQTCNDLISYLLKPEQLQNPSHPFLLLMIQQEYLTVGILLLKLVLISPQSYIHLMTCLSELLAHFHEYPQEDCDWLIGLFETVQVMLTLVISEGQYYSFPESEEAATA